VTWTSSPTQHDLHDLHSLYDQRAVLLREGRPFGCPSTLSPWPTGEGTMTSMTTLPFGRPLTRADLDDLPEDDGHRYELIDGVLIVSPSPRHAHQVVVGNLHLLLRAACPADLQVILAPFAVALADDTEVQPDLLVAPRSQFTATELPGPPLLAVEVLSPSTRGSRFWSCGRAATCRWRRRRGPRPARSASPSR
jgi:hypothetical protein